MRQSHTADTVTALKYLDNDFNQVVNVALGIYTARNCQANQVHLCSSGEHQCADFNRTYTSLEIQLCRQRDTGKLIGRNAREEGTCIDIDGVSARGLNNRNAGI